VALPGIGLTVRRVGLSGVLGHAHVQANDAAGQCRREGRGLAAERVFGVLADNPRSQDHEDANQDAGKECSRENDHLLSSFVATRA
jgi:hypothetical protein